MDLEKGGPLYSVGSTEAHVPCGIQDIDALLQSSIPTDHCVRHIIYAAQRGIFLIWVTPSPDNGLYSLEEAGKKASNFFMATCSDPSLIMAFSSGECPKGDEKPSSYMLIISQIDGLLGTSLQLLQADQRALNEMMEAKGSPAPSWKLRFRGHSKFSELLRTQNRLSGWKAIASAGLLLAFILIAWATLKRHLDNNTVWMRYDTQGSQGPKYQLQFDHRNATTWAAQNPHGNGEWALRIDDQAMVPIGLLDEDEIRYQKWFRRRYPEMDQIRLDESYLNETFLSDPYSIQVPSDNTFHMAHCVLALRRYWKAKESGKHVCPRDIDFTHMKHCLDALDEWAFPDGDRGDDHHPMGLLNEQIVLIWKTKVCFD